jgi:Iron/manganese superoxide dismutases, C-terminal domain
MCLQRVAAILTLDMYEHSYHIDFGAKAGNYVDAFMRRSAGTTPIAYSARLQTMDERGPSRAKSPFNSEVKYACTVSVEA